MAENHSQLQNAPLSALGSRETITKRSLRSGLGFYEGAEEGYGDDIGGEVESRVGGALRSWLVCIRNEILSADVMIERWKERGA